MQSRDLKNALHCLVDAGLIQLIYRSSAAGLPINSTINEKKFKILFLDIGLVKARSFLDINLLFNDGLILLNQGALAEQFVGQELLALRPAYLPGELFYWKREKKGALAEVDYVISVDSAIVPVEVKAGKTGSLRSLHYFLNNKPATLGVRISMKPLQIKDNILTVPHYLIQELPRLIRENI